MSGVEVLRLPLAVNLAGFVTLLRRLRVPHRVIEQDNQQVLWVPDSQLAEQVRELYQRYPQGLGAEQLVELPTFSTGRGAAWRAQLRASPMTLAMLLVTLVVTLLTRFGNNIELDRWLAFVDFRVVGDQLYFLPPGHNLTQA